MTAPKRGARYTVSEKVLEQRRKAARGGKSGRPPKRFKYPPGTPRAERDELLDRGKAALADVRDLWIMLVKLGLSHMRKKGYIPERDQSPILRAQAELASRFGLPPLTEHSIKTTTPPKLIGTVKAVWRDEHGQEHAIEAEGAPEDLH